MLRYALLFVGLLSGCATTDYAVVDGLRTTQADPDEFDVLIVAIDQHQIFSDQRRQLLKPGFHLLQIATTKPGFHGELTYQAFPLNVERCTRYTLAARHSRRLSAEDWTVVVKGKAKLPKCE